METRAGERRAPGREAETRGGGVRDGDTRRDAERAGDPGTQTLAPTRSADGGEQPAGPGPRPPPRDAETPET